MTVTQSLIAFTLAAGLLTITPGPDSALVLRAAAARRTIGGAAAGAGIAVGCLVWGAVVAMGLGALLAASETAYAVLKLAGAAYLIWLGANLILNARSAIDLAQAPEGRGEARIWMARGLLTNLLNPKIGVFYVSFLPQFVPDGAPVAAFTFALAAWHVALSIAWFGLLIAAVRPLRRWLERPVVVRWLDRTIGVMFTAFGVRLALSRAG